MIYCIEVLPSCSQRLHHAAETSSVARRVASVNHITFCFHFIGCSHKREEYKVGETRKDDENCKCEPITIPLCQNIQYNETVFPNLLNHTSQQEAGLEVHQFWPLVEVNCSPYLQHFLCSVYAPNCTVHKTPIPPCRSLCLEVKNGCLELMRRNGFSWPRNLNCDQYPLFGTRTQCWKGEFKTRSLSMPKPGVNTGKFQF